MVEIIAPADAETAIIAYLTAAAGETEGLEELNVAGSLATSAGTFTVPAEAIVVRATGGTARDLVVNVHQVTLTTWAPSSSDELQAWQLSSWAMAHMLAAERAGMLGSIPCYRVQPFSLPYNDPDPVTGRARYSQTFGVSLRGSVLR